MKGMHEGAEHQGKAYKFKTERDLDHRGHCIRVMFLERQEAI